MLLFFYSKKKCPFFIWCVVNIERDEPTFSFLWDDRFKRFYRVEQQKMPLKKKKFFNLLWEKSPFYFLHFPGYIKDLI